jgi:predicted ester cyclase
LGVNEWQQALGAFFTGFPDARFTIDDMIAEGEKVATRHTFQGTHRGSSRALRRPVSRSR